jgi:hypothetical protein
MRAKVSVSFVTQFDGSEQIQMKPVTNGSPEDNTFSKYTPAGVMELTITNPDLLGKFAPGDKMYVDFTPVEEEGA